MELITFDKQNLRVYKRVFPKATVKATSKLLKKNILDELLRENKRITRTVMLKRDIGVVSVARVNRMKKQGSGYEIKVHYVFKVNVGDFLIRTIEQFIKSCWK